MLKDRRRGALLQRRAEVEALEVDLVDDLAAGALLDGVLEPGARVVEDGRLEVVEEHNLGLAVRCGDRGLALGKAVLLSERAEVLVRLGTVVRVARPQRRGAGLAGVRVVAVVGVDRYDDDVLGLRLLEL